MFLFYVFHGCHLLTLAEVSTAVEFIFNALYILHILADTYVHGVYHMNKRILSEPIVELS
jgi:hypothetical protein